LPLAPFCHHNTERGHFGRFLKNADVATGATLVVNPYAVFPLLQSQFRRMPIHGHFVGLGMLETGVRQLVSNVAIVGQHHQAFAFSIQTTNHK
jgi:hypothetical protein